MTKSEDRMTNQTQNPNDEWRRLASPGVTPTEAEGARLGTSNALSGRGLTAAEKRLAARPGVVPAPTGRARRDYAVAGGGNPEGSGQAAGWGGTEIAVPGITSEKVA